MTHTLTVELSEAAFVALQREAAASNASPTALAATALEQRFGQGVKNGRSPMTEADRIAARQRFKRHFGEVAIGHPSGADNETIDADLAREYGDRHEAE